MRPVGSAVGRSRVSPNAITLVGLAVQVLVALAIIDGRLLAAGLIAIVAGLVDALDGAVAKAVNKTSRFGALLDSTVDRLVDALFFVPVAWLYGVAPDTGGRDQPVVAALALTALVASFLVSYVKARAEGLGYECRVGIVERAERVVLMIIGLVFNAILPAVLLVLAGLSTVTVAQRLLHVRSQARTGADRP